jgi:hypothetical protein
MLSPMILKVGRKPSGVGCSGPKKFKSTLDVSDVPDPAEEDV